MNARLLSLVAEVRASYWFLPSLMMLAAFGLAALMIYLDGRVDLANLELPLITLSQPAGARAFLGTVAASMLSVASLTFSIVMVVLTMASSQFGPRLVGNFMRDRGNQVVLGTFISTFLYCLLVLRVVRGAGDVVDGYFVPQLSINVAMVLVVANLIAFIYFIHHTAEGIQVSNVIAEVGRSLGRRLAKDYPEKPRLPGAEVAPPADGEAQLADGFASSAPLNATESGYLRAVDEEGLKDIACSLDLVLKLPQGPGAYIMRGAPLVQVHPESKFEACREQLSRMFAVGDERTPEQDLEFLFDQLLEVALRALSPGVNDPITATMCIDRIADNLAFMQGRALPSPFRYDDDGAVRLIVPVIDANALLPRLFGPIRAYARSDFMVLSHLLAVLERLAARSDDPRFRQVLRDEAGRVSEEAKIGLSPGDYQRLLARFPPVKA